MTDVVLQFLFLIPADSDICAVLELPHGQATNSDHICVVCAGEVMFVSPLRFTDSAFDLIIMELIVEEAAPGTVLAP